MTNLKKPPGSSTYEEWDARRRADERSFWKAMGFIGLSIGLSIVVGAVLVLLAATQ